VKNEFSRAILLAEWNQCCQQIITFVLKMTFAPLSKGFNQAKSQDTPSGHQRHFRAVFGQVETISAHAFLSDRITTHHWGQRSANLNIGSSWA
jgi:hypothetical protein